MDLSLAFFAVPFHDIIIEPDIHHFLFEGNLLFVSFFCFFF